MPSQLTNHMVNRLLTKNRVIMAGLHVAIELWRRLHGRTSIDVSARVQGEDTLDTSADPTSAFRTPIVGYRVVERWANHWINTCYRNSGRIGHYSVLWGCSLSVTQLASRAGTSFTTIMDFVWLGTCTSLYHMTLRYRKHIRSLVCTE